MHECPQCHGKGWSGPVHINRGDKPHEWRDRMDCDCCGGTGQINDDKLQAIELGKKLRAKRVGREESLMEAARRLGLRPSELSGLETGRGGMAAWGKIDEGSTGDAANVSGQGDANGERR